MVGEWTAADDEVDATTDEEAIMATTDRSTTRTTNARTASFHPDRFSTVLASAFVTALVALLAASVLAASSQSSSAAQPTAAYSSAVLRADSAMTDQMSLPAANGPMQRYQRVDPQLVHSGASAGFVTALEQYRAQQDRMLGLAPGDGNGG